MPTWTHERAKIARLSREVNAGRLPADHPELAATRDRFAAAFAESRIEEILAAAPPLTDEQRCRLAELLRPVRQHPGR